MIKEIFDIEPVQKNSLIIFLSLFCLSFLQLYLFKNELLESSAFVSIGLCLALTVCWSVLNFPSLFFFFHSVNDEPSENKSKNLETEVILEIVVLMLGLLAIGWVVLLTYISYELNICFKDFIRLSIIVSAARTLFWFIFQYIKGRKKA